MLYRFYVESPNSNTLPIFMTKIEERGQRIEARVCLDTGSEVTIFFYDMEIMRKLYPDIEETDLLSTVSGVNGASITYRVYKIPSFHIVDSEDKTLTIKDLYCVINSSNKHRKMDILLHGGVFIHSSLTLKPIKRIDESTKETKIGRCIEVDTLFADKETLQVRLHRNDNGKVIGYPAYHASIE